MNGSTPIDRAVEYHDEQGGTSMRIRQLLIIPAVLFALLIAVTDGNAVGRRLGTAGAAELLIPMGAGNIGTAGSNAACVRNTEAMYTNPAGLAYLRNTELGFAYTTYFADMTVSYFTVATKLGSSNALGFAMQSLGIGDIPVTTIASPEGTGETVSPNFLTLSGTFARAFTDRIHMGATAKLVYEQVSDMKGSALAFDLGIQYRSSLGVDVAVVMRNFGTTLHFDGSSIDFNSDVPFADPNATTRKTKLDMASHELPASLGLGVSYGYRFMDSHVVNLSGLYSNNSYTLDEVSGGIEYGFMDRLFARAGYGLPLYPDTYPSDSKESEFGLTLGFGFRIPVSGKFIRFDYAYRETDLLDAVQCIGMAVSF
jgi:hypothetical protein